MWIDGKSEDFGQTGHLDGERFLPDGPLQFDTSLQAEILFDSGLPEAIVDDHAMEGVEDVANLSGGFGLPQDLILTS